MCDKAADPPPPNMFLNAVRLKKCLIKQNIDVFYLILFLIGIQLKRYVI